MAKENGHQVDVEQESIVQRKEENVDPLTLPANIRLQAFNAELSALQQRYGVTLVIDTEQVNPTYIVHRIRAVDVLGR